MKRLLLSFTLVAFAAQASELLLDEGLLIKEIKNSPPTLQKIEAAVMGAKANYSSINDQFQARLEANTYYKKSDEKQLSQYAPVNSPVKSHSLGIKLPTSYGMQLGVKAYGDQYTNSMLTEASTTGVAFEMSVDLYRDIFGRTTRNKLLGAELQSKQAKLNGAIQTGAFRQGLRKLYWQLVANEEALKITKNLLKSSKRQVVEAKKRYRNKVADIGEVSRYQSQVAARNANIIMLTYQKEALIQALKEQIPNWSDKELKLAPYDLESTVNEVLACTAVISQQKDAPLNYTFYDEIINLLKEQKEKQDKVNSAYDSMDVRLQGEYGRVGKDLGWSKAQQNFSDDNKPSYSVGLNISIPLGSRKKTTEDIVRMVDKKKFDADINQNLAKVQAYHGQILKSIVLLQDVVKNQKLNTEFLSKSLKVSKKKYKQARITVQQLVTEQDAYLQSNLDEINTKLTIINTVLDYLSVFSQTPCNLNKK